MSNGLASGGLLGAALQQYEFTFNVNAKGEHYFVFRNQHGNKEPICWSEGYSGKQKAFEAANKVKYGAATAPLRT